MAASDAELQLLIGWGKDDISRLVLELKCPDHWKRKSSPSFALLESIRRICETQSDLSYKDTFTKVFHCLEFPCPTNINGLIAKIHRYVSRAVGENNLHLLLEELPRPNANEIGPACETAGVNLEWLCDHQDGCEISEAHQPVKITNEMIVELSQFRSRHQISWDNVCHWWPKLFPNTTVLSKGTVCSSWLAVVAKKKNQRRSKDIKDFLQSTYVLPEQRPTSKCSKVEKEDDVHEHEVEQNVVKEPVAMSYVLRSHGDTMEILHTLVHEETEKRKKTEDLLLQELDIRKRIEEQCLEESQKSEELEKNCKKLQQEQKGTATRHTKECTKYNKELQKAHELSEALQEELKRNKQSNVAKKLKRRDAEISINKDRIQKLSEEVEKLKTTVTELRRQKKNLTEQKRFHVAKRVEAEADILKDNRQLRKQLKELEKENDDLKAQIDEVMHDETISTFENGAYTSDIRLVCYELIANGVSSRRVSEIVRLVLTRLAGLNVDRLPKPTLIRFMAFEQALLSKHVAQKALQESSAPATLHLDGTSKKHKSYVTSLATTEQGTYGIGLSDVLTESSEGLLHETIDAVTELTTLSNITDNEDTVRRLLLKMKNTMTDRCVVNKKFAKLLEEWRATALPKVYEQWDTISDEIKAEITQVNDLYCGKHVVHNLSEYACSALNDWEEVESNGRKIGREKHTLWNRKGESASILAVRSVCECFGPEAHAQAGVPMEFNDYLKKCGLSSHLQAFRGNRFNTPFENSAATYYHHKKNHIKQVCECLPVCKQNNQLIRCVLYDLNDSIVVSGIRAMGIICSHITTPLMQMLESDVPVINTDKYYTALNTSVKSWMVDPSPLMDDSACMFVDFPAQQNDVHKCLYENVGEEVEMLTKQALSIILHNMYVCVQRQLVDHLPGGKFHQACQRVQDEVKTCPKDNLAAERMFAGLDYLKRERPNISTLAMQGILLWTQNRTAEYLDNCTPGERDQLIKTATQKRKYITKLYQDKVKSIRMKRQEQMEEIRKSREAKQLSRVAQAVQSTKLMEELCGSPCTTEDSVEQLINQKSGEKKIREALISQLKYYKTVCNDAVKGSVFYLSSQGKPLTNMQLKTNLLCIIDQVHNTGETSAAEASEQPMNTNDKDKSREQLKQKLLEKLKPKKRKAPFPVDEIISKRVRHKCLPPGGKRLVSYKGTVLRKSTDNDIDQYIEDDDRKYVGQYTFYTLMYDPPYADFFTYPLQKDWEENCLDIL